MESNKCNIGRWEGGFRICALLLLVVAAVLVGFDRQTKVLFGFIKRTATYKDVQALKVLIWVDSAAAVYNLLQLGRYSQTTLFKTESKRSYVTVAWVSFLLDQVTVYMVVATNLASVEVGVLAITGEKGFQWMKLCDRYTSFCIQFGGALLAGFFAFLLLASISFISAFNLFTLYSPKRFLLLKPPSKPTSS